MSEQSAIIRAVCISEKKGEQKHPVASAHLRPEHGIDGDAHAGNWHRQVSLLGQESVDRLQEKIGMPLFPGAFAENILCEGITLYELPVGTRLRIGTALCEVTQIGKECHADCAASCRARGSSSSSSRRGMRKPGIGSRWKTADKAWSIAGVPGRQTAPYPGEQRCRRGLEDAAGGCSA